MLFIRTIVKPAILIRLIFFILFFSGCADKIKTDIIVFKSLDESLTNSSERIYYYSDAIIKTLEDKLTRPATAERAKIWHIKAKYIRDITKKMSFYIDSLKLDLKKAAGFKEQGGESFKENDKNTVIRMFEKKGVGEELYSNLRQYRKDVLSVDTEVKEVFGKTIVLTTPSLDSTGTGNVFTKTFFDDIPVAAALAVLSKFQNSIIVAENKIITFCDNKIGSVDGRGFYSSYTAIAVISSSYVKANDNIEITAGIGNFSKAALPEVLIDDKNVPINEDGAALYKFKATREPGRHVIPVRITFIDQDGKQQTMIKDLEYTVVQ